MLVQEITNGLFTQNLAAIVILLRKKINAIWIIFGMFAIGIFGYWGGILAPGS